MKPFRTLAVMALSLTFAALSLHAQTLDEILQQNYKARGGLDRMKSKQTVKTTAKSMMGGMELPIVILMKRPSSIRSEITVQGQKIISVFDGTTGWMINPMTGSSDPVDLPSEELKSVKEQADFDGLLVGWKEKGHKVEYVGKEDVEGADAYHLKVTTKEGEIRHFYLDADSYLEIQQKGKYPAQGREIEITNSLGSYKAVDSLMIPFSQDSKTEGKTFQQLLIEKVEFNIPVPDSLFVRPKPKK